MGDGTRNLPNETFSPKTSDPRTTTLDLASHRIASPTMPPSTPLPSQPNYTTIPDSASNKSPQLKKKAMDGCWVLGVGGCILDICPFFLSAVILVYLASESDIDVRRGAACVHIRGLDESFYVSR